ncbi:hypothetical protein ES319_D01G248300v1 [Gossypium barbadense]|uniref:RING-type E3 ubiquitin transferase n=2 Tax=Gossypium TaxID=3633 RepID=A0A5J5SSP4_GOSBA|nr:hypothetical protein ES319_D01G248300v1 [Gossypium barbadense]TYG84639.1 hypothetical protein ES288_D01G265300v1 [Gossypium darwinii]
MAGNYRFAMDQKDLVRTLITTVGSFIQDRLIDKEQRVQHKEQCAERLAAEDGSSGNDVEVRYSDQAVLANLDWGIEALEEAINTSNIETKHARFDYAEKMLQVCAMLVSNQKTAGVPNSYLSAWAYLNLSYLWKLRNDVRNSVIYVLEMFIVEPFFSRIDFAPELWKNLFLPHMSSIAGWYAEARHKLIMEVVPDSNDISFTADLDQFFNESLVFSMRPDQIEKMKKLEQLYSESLDENTRLFAKYYKDCMNSDSGSGVNKKVMAPMLPIAEPPMTPLHEVSRSIPDYVKFGPILPKSAGFSPVLKSKHGGREVNSRVNLNSSVFSHSIDDSAAWDPQDGVPEENEDDSDYEAIGSTVQQPVKLTNQTPSPSVFSPVDSPRTSSSKNSSPRSDVTSKRESKSLLRLLSCRIADTSDVISLPISPRKSTDHSISSVDSDGEAIVGHNSERTKSCRKIRGRPSSTSNDHVNIRSLEHSYQNESDEGSNSCISLPLSEKLTSQSRPPKDFVCPITGQIFNDPVTLETGQTYERKAIEEWLNRGSTTCPITRQPLSSNTLPKTNYVLKRLITSWKEQHPDLAQEFSYSETPRTRFNSPLGKEIVLVSPSNRTSELSNKGLDDYVNQRGKRFTRAAVATSPTSVISQATVETIINGLKPVVSCLCTSNNLQECESAVLEIAKLWKDSKGDAAIHSYLSKLTIVNGFMEILSSSFDREVLRASIYILSELIFGDENIGETLTSVDSDFDCLAALLKNGLAEAAVLIYQLQPTFAQLSCYDLVPSLIQIILCKTEESDDLPLMIKPKDAAIAILEQILMNGDENSRSLNALSIVSGNAIPSLVKCMHRVDSRRSIISILLCCMKVDKSCKYLIVTGTELSYVLELYHASNDTIRGICIEFLSELVQLNRRTLCNQILEMIKTEGAFSTMHTFLVYLQMAPMEHQPAIATLLLQLDLLVEPRKMSIYREEAIEALIESLRKKEFPNQQTIVLDALLSLPGRITSSGESYIEAWLLKIAGFDQPYNGTQDWTETMESEEKAICTWEKRVAFVLCNHEKGCIFKALEECFKSNSLKMAKSCLVITTWLIYMLSILPDTGVRDAARESLLDEFINVLQSSKNLEEKILAVLALKAFINDPTAIEELGQYANCIYKTLRKLKRNSFMATDILKALMNLSSVNATELWSYTDIGETDSSSNGEVLCMSYHKGCLISSHSDGTIKVWEAGKRGLRLVQEAHEHIKGVTCLYVPSSGDRLYSGSLDKTIRVWALKPEEIQCMQVHDVKEAVYELTANAKFACFVSQGNGVKVYNWAGIPKHINFNKNVRCLAMSGDKIYCGCSGYNIQELDLSSSTLSTFHLGTRKLLGKQTVNSLNIHDDLLYAGGSTVDGVSGKVFCRSSKKVMGTFPTGFDIQRIAVNNDFIFTATKLGMIEVWLKERISRVGAIKMNSKGHAKVTSLVSDMDGGMLFAASSDGKIQAWALD